MRNTMPDNNPRIVANTPPADAAARRRNSRWRLFSDSVFALVGLLLISLLFLLAAIAVMYWTKTDLGIDVFNGHIGDFFDDW
jgi:lipopolysaccharide/colanic/teichoic acid biosynthesis glycosyltransferase